MGTFLQDLRFAARHLRTTPGFSAAAIGTLALGIGATTAIFSTVNAALLRPLPYPDARNLFAIRTALTDGRVTTGLLSGAEIARLNDPSLSIVRAAGLVQQDLTLLGDDGTPVKTSLYGVSEGFFEMFGLPMTAGPGFKREHFAGNIPPVVVISHRIWQEKYGGDPAVVGKPIRFAEVTTTIAGVAPRDFDTPHGADYWFSRGADPQDVNHSSEGFLRVKPGATIEQVRAQMAVVMTGLAHDFPAADNSRVYVVRPLVEQIVGDLSSTLILVLSATALLLVLACVNVTNLLLARGAARAREMAVRVALGAGRGRIVRQLLTESALLATAGALVGLALASAGLRILLAAGAGSLPRLDNVPFDGNVLMFALATLVVTGFVVGFAPALRLAGTDIRTLMNESSRSTSGGRVTARWLGALMVAEVALAVLLVAGAGWLVRGFSNLRTVNPGFAADGRLVFDVSFQGQKYRDGAQVDAVAQDLLGRLRALPGVTDAGMTSNLPLRSGQENNLYVEFRGQPMDPRNTLNSRQRFVSPAFFNTMGVKLVSGRDFSADDRLGTTPVAIVNRTFAHRYLADKDPLGVHFSSGYPTINPQSEAVIIGVVEDVRQKSLGEAAEPAFYSSDHQVPIRRRTVVVRARQADQAASLEAAIRTEVARVDPQMPVDFTMVSDLLALGLQRQQLGMKLMLVFGAAALVLAAVGIYGVIAFAASQRRGEVATRLALGATPGNVFWLVLSQGRTLAVAGSAIGLGSAYLSGRVVASRLYEVRAHDPLILAAATMIVAGIAIAATAIPAYRAARIDPSRVLHLE